MNIKQKNVHRLQSEHFNQQVYSVGIELNSIRVTTKGSGYIYKKVISIEKEILCHSRPAQDSHGRVFKIEITAKQIEKVIHQSGVNNPAGKSKEPLIHIGQGYFLIR